jgi:hypothetical protein
MNRTIKQYERAMKDCREMFVNKMKDYGTSWRVLRASSITDQIFIKAQRIKSIEEKGVQKVSDNKYDEFIGIINYSIMALIRIENGDVSANAKGKAGTNRKMEKGKWSNEDTERLYDKYFEKAKELMENKNHDYGEAWRVMRISSYTDIILMRILRIKQIEDNKGKTVNSEGVDANYLDIVNYGMFALIKMREKSKKDSIEY